MAMLALLAGLAVMTAVSSEEVAVRTLFSDRQAAWERQDVAKLVSEFAEDADYIDSSGSLTTGRKAIEEKYINLFSSAMHKNSRSTQSIKKIRFIHDDVAVVDAEWTLAGLIGAHGQPLPDRSGTSIVIVVKRDSRWQIVTLRATVSVPAQAQLK